MLTLAPLTKLDIAALLKADDVCVHLNSTCPGGVVRAIKRKRRTEKDPYATDVEHLVTATVTLDGYRAKEAFDRGSVKCFEMLGLYASQLSHVYCVFRTLRAGDEIAFRFYPDATCNQYASAKRLHGDALYLDVYRKGRKHASWLLDTQICEDNSARMCSGVPFSPNHQKCADAGSRHVA